MKLRSSYADLTCSGCKRVDTLKALQRGIDESVVLQNRGRDVYGSSEGLRIISDRSVDALRSVTDAFDCYPIPSAPGYVVPWPHLVISPDPASDAFRMKHPCEKCGRYWSVVWGPSPIHPPAGADLGAFAFESNQGVNLAWFGSQRIYDALHRAKLKGWDNIPWNRSPK